MKKILAIVVCGLCLSSPAYADMTWAFIGPLTGSAANYGAMALLGTQQAVDDINQAGGINGQQVTLKTYDDACDPKQAVAIAGRVIADNIRFVFQGDCSGSTLASEKTFIEENILVMNTVASNPKVTDEGGPTIFRGMYRDDAAAAALSQSIFKRFPHKRLAIIHDKSAYGFGIADGVREELGEMGMKPILFDDYDPTSRDFSTLITRLKQARIEVLFVGGYPVEIATILRQARGEGFDGQLVAGDLSDTEFWQIAQQAGEGSLFIFPPDPNRSKDTVWLQNLFKKRNQVFNGWTLYAYASTQVLAKAMRESGSNDPLKVAQTIHQLTLDTILGNWRFDQKGDVQNIPLLLYRWHDGHYEAAED